MSFRNFKLSSRFSEEEPSFAETLQTLYRENNYRGIAALGCQLVKQKMSYDPDLQLDNEQFFPVLSRMARKLSERPKYIQDAVYLAERTMGLAAREVQYPSSLKEAHFLVAEREHARAFLLKIADNLENQDHKFAIYYYIAKLTLDGKLPSKDVISEWSSECKGLCCKLVPLARERNFSLVGTLLASLHAKALQGGFGDDSRLPRFREFLKDSFKKLIDEVKDNQELMAIVATVDFCGGFPPEWDSVVKEACAPTFQNMSPEELQGFWKKQILKSKSYHVENVATVARLVQKVIEKREYLEQPSENEAKSEGKKIDVGALFYVQLASLLTEFCSKYRDSKMQKSVSVSSPVKGMVAGPSSKRLDRLHL
ncbi:MAG: hypothetical protein AB7S81_07115 [Bdellovibrionales bacterium]